MKVSTTITMLLISSLLLFTACKTPKIESITVSKDSSNDTQWHKLKSLKEYSATEYNLGNNIKYLDIRTYIQSMGNQNYNLDGYVVLAKLGKTPLHSFNAKLIKQFKDAPPNIDKESNIRKKTFCLMRGCTSYIANAFMIDKDEKIWSLNEIRDIVKVLGEIDRPAEVKLLLWLNNNLRDDTDRIHKDKYKKTFTGYRVISEYENTLSNNGECGIFTYKIDINKQGKITKELTKKRETPNGCLAMD